MKTIVIGVGKVGYALCANLCAEGHDVTAIDQNHHRLDILDDHLNVNTIEGNAARTEVLQQADIEHADLLIAVTQQDELNMVAAFMAKNAGAANTIARVRNPAYSAFDDEARMGALGLDMLINPEKVTAMEIAKLISFPEAHYVGIFGKGQLLMLELKLPADCPVLEQPLMEMNFPYPCIIAGIQRGEKLLIPKGHDCLKAGDEILVLAHNKDMREIERFLGIHSSKPHRVIIYGGDLCGYYLAEQLNRNSRHLQVKIFEPDAERCEELDRQLDNTLVFQCSGTDVAQFNDENVDEADFFVAVSDDDKENLFACVLAKNMGAKKTICQIRGSDYAHIVEKVGLDKVILPSRLTADAILRFINRRRILSLTRFDDTQGQIAEYSVPENAPCIGKPLMHLGFPAGALVCMIARGNEHIIPQGRDCIQAGDSVLVFSLQEALRKVEILLTGEGN